MKYKSSVSMYGISAKVVEDSVHNNIRVSTLELYYPRFIHSEFMTHRMFSRNAGSSRAIPVKKVVEDVRKSPATPIHWGQNQRGMQAEKENLTVSGKYKPILGILQPKTVWAALAKFSSFAATSLARAGYHKQIVNRILEPFQSIKVVVTATEWDNFFHQRDHKDAQPEMRVLAQVMKEALRKSTPVKLSGGWHLPYIAPWEVEEYGVEIAIKCSAARCARVSYLNHDKSNPNVGRDLELFQMLAKRPYNDGDGHVLSEDDPAHMSPLEHQATPMVSYRERGCWVDGITHQDRYGSYWSGNLREWIQHRQLHSITH